MNWITSLFQSGSQSARKGQALSSTHEAFSIPTSSPLFSSQSDAFNPDLLQEPDTATSASYTYPPQGSPYGYVPTSAGSNSRPPSLLPLHHDPLHSPGPPSAAYPPLSVTWNRLRHWLSREYPELGDTLNYGILPQDLAQIEMQFGFALPAVVRESYLTVDGQEAESAAGCSEGLFFGLTLLPLEDVLEEWRFWREVDEDPSTGANPGLREAMQSIPPDWIRKDYSQRGWIPLIADKAGNYIGVDLNPGEKGRPGQVIVFGRDFDTKVALYNGDGPGGWAKWLASFVEDLESGEGFEIGMGSDDDGSEDELGYESYFYDGSGRGQGDGGGDTGSGGGLRLTGEYRGWNVLEAWADRSVRKWYEAGVISEEIRAEEEKPKAPEIDLGIKNVAQGSAAEVPIPVVRSNGASTSGRKAPPNLPTISVTKPPAPLPVGLPTPRDIEDFPSEEELNHSSYEDDLESGRIPNRMSQISPVEEVNTVSRRPNNENALASSSNPPSPKSLSSHQPSPEPAVDLLVDTGSTPEPASDLLVDTEPVLETTPVIEPSPLPPKSDSSTTPSTTETVQEPPVVEPSSETLVNDTADDDAIDPDVTIRLVGGGGKAGAVNGIEDEEESEEQDAEVASITSATSESSVAKAENGGEKKHKKTKSGLAGLKKLGQLAGMHKKASISSVKDAATADSNP